MSNETKQTAVQWLEEIVNKNGIQMSDYFKFTFEQAKEMEKKRMVEFAENSFDYLLDNNEDCILLTTQDRIEHFYNEIYGGNK
jgi:hypothetical protein